MQQAIIFGIKVHSFDKAEFIQRILNLVIAPNQVRIASANIHNLNLAYRYPRLSNFYRSVDIFHCDGAGVVLAAKLKGIISCGPRLATLDVFFDLTKEFISKKYSIFILGGRPEVAEKAAYILKEQYGELKIAGTNHGYFNKEDPIECRKVAFKVFESGADILFVGMGAPIQEYWVEEWGRETQAKLIWCVGGIFDVIAKETHRGPSLLVEHGFEWLTRLVRNPRRYWRRYTIGNILFFYRLFRNKSKFLKTNGL